MNEVARARRWTSAALGIWGTAAVAMAVGRAVAASPSARPGTASHLVPAPLSVQRAVFAELMRAEPGLREKARRDFPGDRWSADDDFHNHERGLVHELARQHGVSAAAVWDGLDQGLHEGVQAGWPGATTPGVLRTAPPCHPRPTD